MSQESFELVQIGEVKAHPQNPLARAAICHIGDLPPGTALYYKRPTEKRKLAATLHIILHTDPRTRTKYREYKMVFLENSPSPLPHTYYLWFSQTPLVENEQPDVTSHVDGSISHHMWNVVLENKEPGAYPLYTK